MGRTIQLFKLPSSAKMRERIKQIQNIDPEDLDLIIRKIRRLNRCWSNPFQRTVINRLLAMAEKEHEVAFFLGEDDLRIVSHWLKNRLLDACFSAWLDGEVQKLQTPIHTELRQIA